MTGDRDLDIFIRNGLAHGPRLRAHAVREVVDRLPMTPQRRGWLASAGRSRTARVSTRLGRLRSRPADVIAGLVVAVIGGLAILGLLASPRDDDEQPGPVALPSASASPAVSPADEARVIVVATDGSADARNLTDAVAMADDGDTILVREVPFDPAEGSRPRPYLEPGRLVIDKALTIRGEGERARIPIRFDPPAGTTDELGGPLVVRGAPVTIENVTLVPDLDLDLESSPTLTLLDVSTERTHISGIGRLDVRGSDLLESKILIVPDGPSVIEDSLLLDSCIAADHREFDNERRPALLTVRRNEISWDAGIEVWCGGPETGLAIEAIGSPVRIDSNDLSGVGIVLEDADGAVLRGNRIHDAPTAISVRGGDGFLIDANVLDRNGRGIGLVDAAGTVSGNTVSGSATAIEVSSSSVEVQGNDLSDNEVAVSASGALAPRMSGNTFCGNATNMRVLGGSAVTLDGNDHCPDDGSAGEVVRVGSGPMLEWTHVELDFDIGSAWTGGRFAWADDRFTKSDADGAIRESRDGLTWRRTDAADVVPERSDDALIVALGDTWNGTGGRHPSRITLVAPDGSRVSHDFRGPIHSAVGGPAGVIATEFLEMEAVLGDVLGPERVAGGWRLVRERAGTWWVETADRDRMRIDLAAHGLVAAEFADATGAVLAWHSANGVDWTAIRESPITPIAASAEGFWATLREHDERPSLWFSEDGLTWKRVAGPGRVGRLEEYDPIAWNGGLLVLSNRGIHHVRPAGTSDLSMWAPVFGPDGVLPAGPDGGPQELTAGPLGMVSIVPERGLVIFSPDGERWSMADMPDTWSQARVIGFAVGADEMLALVALCRDPSDYTMCLDSSNEHQLWRGTLPSKTP